MAQSSVEPDEASLSPLRSPGVLDLPEVPAVAVSAVAHHSHRVGIVAGSEEPAAVSRHLGLAVAQTGVASTRPGAVRRDGLSEEVLALGRAVEDSPAIELPVRRHVNIGHCWAVLTNPGLQQRLLREELELVVL